MAGLLNGYLDTVATSLDDPAPLMSAIRETVRKADPQIAIEFELAKDVVAATISRQQLGMMSLLVARRPFVRHQSDSTFVVSAPGRFAQNPERDFSTTCSDRGER